MVSVLPLREAGRTMSHSTKRFLRNLHQPCLAVSSFPMRTCSVGYLCILADTFKLRCFLRSQGFASLRHHDYAAAVSFLCIDLQFPELLVKAVVSCRIHKVYRWADFPQFLRTDRDSLPT